jgi:hypothetical protein
MNYESRLERLEQEIAPPIHRPLIAYLHDSDTRPSDWMEVRGQRFDRGTGEDVDDFEHIAAKQCALLRSKPVSKNFTQPPTQSTVRRAGNIDIA